MDEHRRRVEGDEIDLPVRRYDSAGKGVIRQVGKFSVRVLRLEPEWFQPPMVLDRPLFRFLAGFLLLQFRFISWNEGTDGLQRVGGRAVIEERPFGKTVFIESAVRTRLITARHDRGHEAAEENKESGICSAAP